MWQFSLLLVTLVISPILGNVSLPEFQERFAEQSRTVEPPLAEFRAENHALRLNLIHDLVRGFANLTVEIRQLTADTWETIENHPAVNEQCIDVVRNLFDVYVWLGELDIMYAAEEMDAYLRDDAHDRLNPWANFMGRENSRASSQTVRTLGRNDFLGDRDDTTYELEDGLNYFRNLWDGVEEVLRNEIEAMEPFAELVRWEMAWWHSYTVSFVQMFMNLLIQDVHLFCEPEVF